MVTPFLKPFNNDGGTLYVFPSVSKDLTRTFVSNDYEFKFSHFACLNLPDIYSGTFEEGADKGLYLNSLGYSVDFWVTGDGAEDNSEYRVKGMGGAIAEHFQNYIMNFETAILNGEGDNDDYDPDIMTTVSEKIFFNWLQKVGGIKFDGNKEMYTSLEERTIQYIGNIDIMNTVEIDGDSFEELYIRIPSTAGASTSVYFRDGYLTDNKNYLDKKYQLPAGGESCIIGRGDTPHPYGLSKNPIMDSDNGETAYMGDIGHTIDFRDDSYPEGIVGMNGNSMNNFEFNAVLIYYDFYDKTKSNTKKVSTNLYGILFLDNVIDINGGETSSDNTVPVKQGYFQRYPKLKESTYGDGNSFALKVDIKIDTLPDYDSTTITIKSPNDVYSMSLYEKALAELQKSVDFFYAQEKRIYELEQRVEELESLVLGIDRIDELKGRVDWLYNLYDGTSNYDAVMSLIEEHSKKINSIMNGEKNIKLQYDTDVIQAGDGVTIQKDPKLNKIKLEADGKYKISRFSTKKIKGEEITKDNPVNKEAYVKLKTGDNFTTLNLADIGEIPYDINLYIDDGEIEWKKGQSYKIYLDNDSVEDKIEFGDGYGLVINTGKLEDGGTEEVKDDRYSQIIGKNLGGFNNTKITSEELEGKNLIEIICVSDDVKSDPNPFVYLIK